MHIYSTCMELCHTTPHRDWHQTFDPSTRLATFFDVVSTEFRVRHRHVPYVYSYGREFVTKDLINRLDAVC
jgi:hypothetical protein